MIVSIIVSLITQRHELSEERRRLHDTYRESFPARLGSPALRTAKWSLALIWMFLALGPGAILGNTLFVWPSGAGATAVQRVPSLLSWQIVAWLSGVLLVWWLAYRSQLSVTAVEPERRIAFGTDPGEMRRSTTPVWIARGLSRLAARSDRGARGAGRR